METLETKVAVIENKIRTIEESNKERDKVSYHIAETVNAIKNTVESVKITQDLEKEYNKEMGKTVKDLINEKSETVKEMSQNQTRIEDIERRIDSRKKIDIALLIACFGTCIKSWFFKSA